MVFSSLIVRSLLLSNLNINSKYQNSILSARFIKVSLFITILISADLRVNDTAPAVCKDLSLSTVQCDLPLCPFPNDTKLSGLDTLYSKSNLTTKNLTRLVGEIIQFQCADPSKLGDLYIQSFGTFQVPAVFPVSGTCNLFC